MSIDPVSWASTAGVRRSMRSNRGRDTGPELAVRRSMHRMGLRFFVGRRPLPSMPRTADAVFPTVRVAVFVDGCFWHRCPEHATTPVRNADYWVPKLARNAERDRETDRLLEDAGWVVLRVWEHEPAGEAAERVREVVSDRRDGARLRSDANGAHPGRTQPTNVTE